MKMLLLDRIGNLPTRCSLIPQSQAFVQMQTQVSLVTHLHDYRLWAQIGTWFWR